MKSTAINKDITALYSLLTPQQKESVLSMIKSFIKSDRAVSRKQYNRELMAAEKRIQKGKFVSQEDLEKFSGKW